jgi:hypothetical protein
MQQIRATEGATNNNMEQATNMQTQTCKHSNRTYNRSNMSQHNTCHTNTYIIPFSTWSKTELEFESNDLAMSQCGGRPESLRSAKYVRIDGKGEKPSGVMFTRRETGMITFNLLVSPDTPFKFA